MVVGLLFGLGLAIVVSRLPPLRRPSLEQRLAPHLRPKTASSRLLTAPSSGAGRLTRAALVLGYLRGGPGTLPRRLERAGRGLSVEQFRVEQLLWGAAGTAVGALTGVLAQAVIPVPGSVLLVVLGAAAGVLGREQWLAAAIRRREERVLTELPTVAELLALSVGAGEGASGALARVAGVCQGALAEELRRVLAQAHSGAGLVPALEGMARRSDLPAVARFVDGLAVAVERGTPLGEVLRAQAHDVRESSRRRLMESGGRREVLMMVPVVFLVLPLTVLFALFPVLTMLDVRV